MGQPRPLDKKIVLPLTAALPIGKLTMLPREGSYVGRVHIYVSVFNSQGQNVGFSHQLQEVTMSTAQYQAAADPFRYSLNVRLQKGDFTVIVTLRDDLSNELGSSIQNVKL